MTGTINPAATLVVHASQEAARKIAGIGAVLDGIIPEPAYQQAFPATILAGPLLLMDAHEAPLPVVYFDSAVMRPSPNPWEAALAAVAAKYGVRIVFGSRVVGGVPTDVILCSPDGMLRSEVDSFAAYVKAHFGFDLLRFEALYPAIEYEPDASLTRLLTYYGQLDGDPQAAPPDALAPEKPLYDYRGALLYGGVSFTRDAQSRSRARFPRIPALDSFADLPRANHYLVELQFYVYAGAPLWEATRALVELKYKPGNVVLFAHDWLGVPMFWAMRRDPAPGIPATSVYFAHETRVCRLLAEGLIKDKVDQLARHCHPDGHDVSFYGRLSQLEDSGDRATVGQAFAGEDAAFDALYHHAINQQAAAFDHVVAVGRNVARETALILRSVERQPPMAMCPNGIPNLLARALGTGASESELVAGQADARARMLKFAAANCGFSPDYIFSCVSRCEISKAPWRNVEFFRAFVNSPQNREKSALFIWLTRPKPLPSDEEVAEWRGWGWPAQHKPRESGGDLRAEEHALWQLIDQLNAAGIGRYRILYINQFGWGEGRLGSLTAEGTTFNDLRNGVDVELGLSVYEPFGIAPLEPFSSGAVCVLSDACGCSAHLAALQQDGLISGDNFVIGEFSRSRVDPRAVDLKTLRASEAGAYVTMAAALTEKLTVPRPDRIRRAQDAMAHLSWGASVQQLLKGIR